MIGVVSKESEKSIVKEFFQLFKTPWEFYRRDRSYDFVLVTAEQIPANLKAHLVLIYNSKAVNLDEELGIIVQSRQQSDCIEWDGSIIPIYKGASVLHGNGRPFIERRGTPEAAGLEVSRPTSKTVRIGYDLFQEVTFLLSDGQPAANAHIPTLDIHISLLRSAMVSSGKAFLEIPPVPAGYDFMACLSHDVDFTGIREHKLDRTIYGFLYRATIGSLLDVVRGEKSWSKLAQNCKAAFSLPLVYLGLFEDFWLEFDRYLEIEKGLNATYFFIPFKNCSGALATGPAPKARAAKYDVVKSRNDLLNLIKQGCEVGLHGIDSWRDVQKAQIESSRIQELTGQTTMGVRMHWLYFDKESPVTLDRAGFSYDSTVGYNDAVGFRAGTTQVFAPQTTEHLLELPLNIQDTAMFYPGRMNLSETNALASCKQLLGLTARYGGVVTVNWHTRSLSPERLWGDFYAALLREMRGYKVWFGTAQDIVTWFRNRRAMAFRDVEFTSDGALFSLTGPSSSGHPPFLVRIHNQRSTFFPNGASSTVQAAYSDVAWTSNAALNN